MFSFNTEQKSATITMAETMAIMVTELMVVFPITVIIADAQMATITTMEVEMMAMESTHSISLTCFSNKHQCSLTFKLHTL